MKLKSPDTEELVEKAIQDLSAGGTSMPGCEPGYIALWAVNFAGQVDIETTFLIIDHQPYRATTFKLIVLSVPLFRCCIDKG